MFVSNDSVLYDLQQTGSTGVLIRLTSNELAENSTLPQLSSVDIPDNILLYNEEVKLFIPGCESPNVFTVHVYISFCMCAYICKCACGFLNQAHTGCRPVHTWFLKIDPVQIIGMHICVCVRVCVSAPETVNN